MFIYVRRTVRPREPGSFGLAGFIGIMVLAGVALFLIYLAVALFFITLPVLIVMGVIKWRKRGRTSSASVSPSSSAPPVWRGMSTSLLDTLDQESSSRRGSGS